VLMRWKWSWTIPSVGLALLGLWPQSPITEENYERIKKGMTQEQVSQILGPSWTQGIMLCSGPLGDRVDSDARIWSGTGNRIQVDFDNKGRVNAAVLSRRSVLEVVTEWLGW
jgi:hypothetical protein